MRWFLPVLITAAFAAPMCHASADDAPQYSAVFNATTHQVDMRLCLTDAHAAVQFAADSAWAMRFVAQPRRADGSKLTAGEAGWSARDWQAGECLTYSADLGAIAAEHKSDIGWQLGEDLVTAPQLWLLRPDVQGAATAELRIDLPPGWAISAPWRQSAPLSGAANASVSAAHVTASSATLPARAGNSIHFTLPNTPADWSAAVAIGQFREEPMQLAGGVLRLSILHGADSEQRTKLHAWLDRVSRAVLSAYGRLPLPEVQVLVIPIGELGLASRAAAAADPEPVHFGQSIRGQGNALELLVDASRPAAEFSGDWTAVHELSHLMHPSLGDRGTWLAEGLATYYQNVLRARSGLLTAAQAWDRLREGFKRGARAKSGESLEDVAQDMHRSHAFQRVYWAGAAYWLTVDRDLRRASDGAKTLDLALAGFRDCCLPAYREWNPDDFVARLDKLANTQIFSTRFREFAQMREFPDWQPLFADFGIGDGGEHLVLAADAKDAAIRDTIMAPLATVSGAAVAR